MTRIRRIALTAAASALALATAAPTASAQDSVTGSITDPAVQPVVAGSVDFANKMLQGDPSSPVPEWARGLVLGSIALVALPGYSLQCLTDQPGCTA